MSSVNNGKENVSSSSNNNNEEEEEEDDDDEESAVNDRQFSIEFDGAGAAAAAAAEEEEGDDDDDDDQQLEEETEYLSLVSLASPPSIFYPRNITSRRHQHLRMGSPQRRNNDDSGRFAAAYQHNRPTSLRPMDSTSMLRSTAARASQRVDEGSYHDGRSVRCSTSFRHIRPTSLHAIDLTSVARSASARTSHRVDEGSYHGGRYSTSYRYNRPTSVTDSTSVAQSSQRGPEGSHDDIPTLLRVRVAEADDRTVDTVDSAVTLPSTINQWTRQRPTPIITTFARRTTATPPPGDPPSSITDENLATASGSRTTGLGTFAPTDGRWLDTENDAYEESTRTERAWMPNSPPFVPQNPLYPPSPPYEPCIPTYSRSPQYRPTGGPTSAIRDSTSPSNPPPSPEYVPERRNEPASPTFRPSALEPGDVYYDNEESDDGQEPVRRLYVFRGDLFYYWQIQQARADGKEWVQVQNRFGENPQYVFYNVNHHYVTEESPGQGTTMQ